MCFFLFAVVPLPLRRKEGTKAAGSWKEGEKEGRPEEARPKESRRAGRMDRRKGSKQARKDGSKADKLSPGPLVLVLRSQSPGPLVSPLANPSGPTQTMIWAGSGKP